MDESGSTPVEGTGRSRATVLKAILLYTVVLGSLTVAGVFLATRSGGPVLLLAVVGLAVVTFVGGTGDAFSSSAAVQTEHLGGVAGDQDAGHGWDPGGMVIGSKAEALLLYGLGLLLWSVLALAVFWNTLV